MLKIYRYQQDFGRRGSLDGVFVLDDKIMDMVMGSRVSIGEALGKYSDVYCEITTRTITEITDDQEFINKCEKLKIFGGTNPFYYVWCSNCWSNPYSCECDEFKLDEESTQDYYFY